MLRVWFICSFVPSEHCVSMTAPLQVLQEGQETWNGAFFDVWRIESSGSPSTVGCQVLQEVCTTESKCLKFGKTMLLMQAVPDTHPHPETKKKSMKRAQVVALGYCRVTVAENCCKTCSSLVQTSTLATVFTSHSLSTYGLHTTEPHSQHVSVTLSYSTTRSQKCWQSCSKNIIILTLLFEFLSYKTVGKIII